MKNTFFATGDFYPAPIRGNAPAGAIEVDEGFFGGQMGSVGVVLWDDITMDFFWAIVGTAVELILSFIAPLFLLTGELSLGILSIGYYRPQLKKETFKSELPYREVSFWVGLIIWIGILLYLTTLRSEYGGKRRVLNIRGPSLENLLLRASKKALSSGRRFHGLMQHIGDP